MASEAPRTAQVGPRTMIERVPSDRNLTNVIEQWKALRPEWDVTALVAPLYWIMMSMAAVKALSQLVGAPTFWEKTVHGLHHESQPVGVDAAS